MKRGKDEEKTMGPMFPRLHVNDTEKGGPRAPPRNKMALYEQLSIPSHRFSGGVVPFNPKSTAKAVPPSSSAEGATNERGMFFPLQQPPSIYPAEETNNRFSDLNNQLVQQEQKKKQDEDDFRVPIFVRQSGISQNRSGNHQNRGHEGPSPISCAFSGRLSNVQNARQSSKVQKENSQDFAKSGSNQSSRQNTKDPSKETNGSSSFGHINTSNNSKRLQSNGNLQGERVDSQAENTLWGDSVLNEATRAMGNENASQPVRAVQRDASRSPNDPTNGDAVSETSIVDSICGVDISPDDVVGIIGQKHFWKARRAIVNQQRVFAVQVFELHRLIKVQRLIAGSPQLLVEENEYLGKPPKVSPFKKIPLEYVVKSIPNEPKPKDDCEKPNDDMEFSAENAVGKGSLSSVQNTTNCRPFSGNPFPPSEPKMGAWSYNQPPGHQWLIPVMSPSEGLVYKAYPGPGFMSPSCGGYGPPGSTPMIGSFDSGFQTGHNVPNYGVPPHYHHQHEGPTGAHPFVPPASHGYFPPYGMPMMHQSISGSGGQQKNLFNVNYQSNCNVPSEHNGSAVPNVAKFHARKDNEVQASTGSSPSEKTQGRTALTLFPTSSPAETALQTPREAEPARVIRVVPHNARSATASVARIFQSIQEERKQHDST